MQAFAPHPLLQLCSQKYWVTWFLQSCLKKSVPIAGVLVAMHYSIECLLCSLSHGELWQWNSVAWFWFGGVMTSVASCRLAQCLLNRAEVPLAKHGQIPASIMWDLMTESRSCHRRHDANTTWHLVFHLFVCVCVCKGVEVSWLWVYRLLRLISTAPNQISVI